MIIDKLPIVGGKIKDATALPADVRQGKIFYNNEGKQTGRLRINELKSITINIPSTANVNIPASRYCCNGINMNDGKLERSSGGTLNYSSGYSKAHVCMNINILAIKSVTIDGTCIDCLVKPTELYYTTYDPKPYMSYQEFGSELCKLFILGNTLYVQSTGHSSVKIEYY